MDLNDNCLIEIFSNLSKFELFVLGEMRSRFIVPTEICYHRNFADKQFVTGEWSLLKHRVSGLKFVIEYFGRSIRNVCLDRKFLQAIESESIAELFLVENMPNVKRAWIGYAAAAEIVFLSQWMKTEELELCDFDSIDVRWHWPHLITLHVHTCSSTDNFIQFLKSHKTIRQLHLNAQSSSQLIGAIACNLHNLDLLNIGYTLPTKINVLLICQLITLEHLVTQIGQNVKPFKNLKKLKCLKICNTISFQNLLDLVEFVPTLNRIELWNEVRPAFTRNAVNDLVKRRKLSAHCRMEQLLLISPLDRLHRENKSESTFIDVIENKYVSCFYFDCDDDHPIVSNRPIHIVRFI